MLIGNYPSPVLLWVPAHLEAYLSTWDHRKDESTRGRLIALLRRTPSTVDEMAKELGVTSNAIRAQLATLERDGMVRQHGLRRGTGKPSFSYALSTEFEPLLSRAYIPILLRLLRQLGERLPPEQVTEILRDVGEKWAEELPRATGSLAARAKAASTLLNELGGVTDVEEDGRCLVIRGYSCPLAVAVRQQPRICAAIETLLSRYLDHTVTEHCDREGERVRCRFEMERQAESASR